MRPLLYSINLSLDGCCDHAAEFTPDAEVHNYTAEMLAEADALLFGRVTYQLMEFWRLPPSGEFPDWMEDWAQPFARMMNTAKKLVVSRTLGGVDWNNAELLGGDLIESVRKLKAMPGKPLYTGGVDVPRQLAEAGLIDQYEFIVHPLIVGRGRYFFEGLSKAVKLELVGERKFASGAIALKYIPRG